MVTIFYRYGKWFISCRNRRREVKGDSDEALESIAPVHELYYHAVSKQLFVGNYKEGILIYDMGEQEKSSLVNSPIM